MKVQSSTIDEVLYDFDKNELTVTFVSGGVYVYADVPADVYAKFMDSESKGRFFHADIKESYVCTKLR